jgi:hypothetical protein
MDALASIGLAFVGLCALVVIVIFLRAMPRSAFLLWCLTMFFVPFWIGVTVGFFWTAISIVTILAVVACGGSIRLIAADGVMAAFMLLVFGQFALGIVNLSTMVTAVLEWVVPYIWGRLVLHRVSAGFLTGAIAVFATLAAVIALIEFATRLNVFVLLPPLGPSYEIWGPLQYRSGLLRAEGAWGHSIALGAGLAMSSAFVLAARWRTFFKLVALAVIAAAIVVTFSRIGLVTFVLAVALSVFVLPQISRGARVGIAIAGLVAAIFVVPFISSVFLEAGQEAGGSADYRGDLFSLFSQVQLFGSAQDWTGLTVGGQYLGAFASSVDNAFLVIALRVGWIPLLLLAVVLLAVVVSVLRPGHANPASIAVAAQVPGLFAVALITQFGLYFWFMVGLGLAWNSRRLDGAEAGGPFDTSRLAPAYAHGRTRA